MGECSKTSQQPWNQERGRVGWLTGKKGLHARVAVRSCFIDGGLVSRLCELVCVFVGLVEDASG